MGLPGLGPGQRIRPRRLRTARHGAVPTTPLLAVKPKDGRPRDGIHNAGMGTAPTPPIAPGRAPAQSTRDRGITALVEGFFASVWFGWGQAHAPASLSAWLHVGEALGLVVAVTGAVIG